MPASTWPITTRLMCVFSFTCDAGRARSRINAPLAGFRVFACLRGCCRWPVQSLRLPQRPRGRKRRHRRHGGYLVIARHRLAAVRDCSISGRAQYIGSAQQARNRLETHHGCCMEPTMSMSPGPRFHEPVLRFLKTRRLTAAGGCLCGRHDRCCACFRASVGPKSKKKGKAQPNSSAAGP